MLRIFTVPTLLALAALLVACSGSEEPHDDSTHSHTTGTNAATNDTTGVQPDIYSDGMSKVGAAGVQFTLVSAEPAPPDVGENTWTIRVVDADGAPLDGAIVNVAPFMPAHDHGTSPADYSGAFVEDGAYVVGPFNLFMPGTWDMTVSVEADAGDSVVFSFALEG